MHVHMHASKHECVTCTVTDSLLIGLLFIHTTQRAGHYAKYLLTLLIHITLLQL